MIAETKKVNNLQDDKDLVVVSSLYPNIRSKNSATFFLYSDVQVEGG